MKKEDVYKALCEKKSDINQHLPTLKKYAGKCNHVTEFGVRGIVSTWALICGNPRTLISYDLYHPRSFKGDLSLVYALREETKFSFIKANVLEIDIEPTDLLFIDTLHTCEQLSKELHRHSKNVRKYIVLHDTKTFSEVGEDGGDGLSKALTEFIASNNDWVIKEVFNNNNGLTVLENINIKLFSIIIPTMWRSPFIWEMLPKYQVSEFVGEVIIIDNAPSPKNDVSAYDKVKMYTKGENIFVNPAWNWGVSLAKYSIVLANDDILIEDLDIVLGEISRSNFDIVGAGIKPDDAGRRIKNIQRFPANSFGCFMFVKNYVAVPETIRMWYGDDIQFYHNKKRGVLMNFGITTRKSTTIDSERAYFRGVIGRADIAEYKRLLVGGMIPKVI